MKSRGVLLSLLVAFALIPASAGAEDQPATTSPDTSTVTEALPTDGTVTDPATPTPITIDPSQIETFQAEAEGQDDNKNAFEKASDFVTDNAPWFIIGIIIIAAITAGILIMRSRPRKSRAEKPSKAAKAAKATSQGQAPADVPSASELRRRKRAAAQRQREEERMRRKAGIEGRQAPGGGMPAGVGPAAVGAAGMIDPVEAEKQGARDQQTAAAAVARYGGAVPAPVSPTQIAPAYGVVTPEGSYAPEPVAEPDTIYEPAPQPEAVAPQAPASDVSPVESSFGTQAPAPEADTTVIPEPALESPAPDAAVGDAAGAFLAGGAAGALGGVAAARAAKSNTPEADAEVEESLDPVVSPEPGMAPEHAISDTEIPPAESVSAEYDDEETSRADQEAAEAEERLRAKVAEIKASQEPTPQVTPEADLSPGLAAVERSLSEHSEERDRALRDAEERLRQVEQRTEEAERRAAFAERLAQLKIQESERDQRLNEVVSSIDRAEQRALEAESRALAAEQAAAAALEQSELNLRPKSPEPGPSSTAPEPIVPRPEPVVPPAPRESEFSTPPAPERRGLFEGSEAQAAASSADTVNLNSATFEELRDTGLSVTQATRILAYRERFGGYSSVEDLEKVPGFPDDLIQSLSGKISV